MSLGLWGPNEAEWKSTLSYYQLSASPQPAEGSLTSSISRLSYP